MGMINSNDRKNIWAYDLTKFPQLIDLKTYYSIGYPWSGEGAETLVYENSLKKMVGDQIIIQFAWSFVIA